MKPKNLLLAAALAIATQAFAASYTGWYSRDITLNPATAGIHTAVSGFPLLVRLNTGNFNFAQSLSDLAAVPTATSYTAPGGADIRFTASDGTTDLPFQIERWDGVKKVAEIWVLIPSVSASVNTVIKMFWGGMGSSPSSLPVNDSGPIVFAQGSGFASVHHLVTDINATVSEPSSTLLDPSSLAMQKASGTSIFGTVADSNIIGFGTTLNGVTNAYSINSSKNNIWTDYQAKSTYTLSAWVKNTNTAATQSRVISKSGEFYLGTSNDGSKWEMAEYEDSAGTQFVNVPMTTGWSYVAGVRNGNAMTLYVNGTSSSTIRTDSTRFGRPTSSSVAPNVIQTVGIGREVGSTSAAPVQGLYFKGSLDEVRLENVARTADWITLNYATQKASVTALTYGAVNVPASIFESRSQIPGLKFRRTGSSIALQLPALPGNARITIRDIYGRILWNYSIEAGMREVSTGEISSFVPGIYLVRLTDASRTLPRTVESKVLLTP